MASPAFGSRFTEAQVAFVLRQAEEGTSVGEVCRKADISEATFYAWRKKYAGLMSSEMKRLRRLEDENSKLKKLVADLSLDKAICCRTCSAESCEACAAARTGRPRPRHLEGLDASGLRCVADGSTAYLYRSRRGPQAALVQRIKEAAETRVRYRYRRIHVLLRREGWQINAKRIYRLYKESGLQLPNKVPKRRVKAKLREDSRPAVEANETWAMEFVHDQLATGRKVRILTVVDTFTRFAHAHIGCRPRCKEKTSDRVWPVDGALRNVQSLATCVMSCDPRENRGNRASHRMYRNFSGIFVATLLRDMRTRFGRTYVSFLISIAWPLSHLAIICIAYYFTNKVAPIGDDPDVFATTGVVPYIFCLYPARFTAFAVLQNKALLQFAIIKPLHLIAARAFLELLSASVVFAIFSAIMLVLGVAIIPFDIHQAFAVLAATIFLGLGFGFFGVTLCSFNPMVGVLTIVFSVAGLYMTSGAFLPVSLLSGPIRAALFYNPLYHSVGLLRATYFDGYDGDDCRIGYILLVGAAFFFLGLAGERLVRGRIMN